MRTGLSKILAAAILFITCLYTCEPASALPAVQDIVDQVSQTAYTNYLDNTLYTHTGSNRGIGGAQHDLARDNIYSEFNSFGLAASYQPFTYSGSTYYNVVGVHPGTTRPDDIFIVGAHYDSTSSGSNPAPGADDNGSGSAGVLEAARVLSQYEFEATLIFIGFDREEQGLYGSKAYALQSYNSGDNILGMISLDMITYNPDGANKNKAQIRGRDGSAALKLSLADAMTLYGGGLTGVIGGALNVSDHSPFEDYGYDACLLIEYSANPYYHTSNDSVDTLNYIDYTFATKIVSSTVGFLADAAVPIPEPATMLLLVFGAVLARKRPG